MHPPEELATVEEATADRVVLALPWNEACRECGACARPDARTMRLELPNTIGAVQGEQVRVVLDVSRLRIAVILFGLPTALLLAALLIGAAAGHDGIGLAAGGLVVAVYYALAGRRWRDYRPRLERMDSGEPID